MHSTESTHWAHAERSAPPSGFRAQLARGLHLTGISLRVLVHDPHLLALPFLALVFSGFVWLLVFISFWAVGYSPAAASSTILYQEMFVAYLLTYFLCTYFMAAIVGAADTRLQGHRPTVSDGFRAANGCFFRIVAWSLFAATFGVLLRLASLRWEQAGRIQARILGNPWPIASVFVLPAMAVEDLGPVGAFRRSRHLVRERWGSHPSGVLGTGVVFLLLWLCGFVPLLWGILGDGGYLGVGLAVLLWLGLMALWSVVHGILVTSLYHYATESSAAFGFSWKALNHPWIR
ncbi:MAG TPA: hypothetical protein HA326_09460 [Thermoplasmata archaeon]|nr:hypothetical protein [Thermoplasmata archaeon]